MEINNCYVCLEECQEEFSPCECKIPIHHKCFIELTNLQECTVCKEAYIFEDIEIVHEPQEHIIVIKKKSVSSTIFPIILGILTLCGIWYFAGMFGKALWVIMGGKLTYNTYEFWNNEHAISACVTMFCSLIFYVIWCRKKRSLTTAATV